MKKESADGPVRTLFARVSGMAAEDGLIGRIRASEYRRSRGREKE